MFFGIVFVLYFLRLPGTYDFVSYVFLDLGREASNRNHCSGCNYSDPVSLYSGITYKAKVIFLKVFCISFYNLID